MLLFWFFFCSDSITSIMAWLLAIISISIISFDLITKSHDFLDFTYTSHFHIKMLEIILIIIINTIIILTIWQNDYSLDQSMEMGWHGVSVSPIANNRWVAIVVRSFCPNVEAIVRTRAEVLAVQSIHSMCLRQVSFLCMEEKANNH